MNNTGWFSGLLNQQPTSARVRRAAGAMAVAMLIATAGIAVAQDVKPAAPAPESKFTTPEGYWTHHTIDMGGRMSNQSGSNAMYDTLVNLQSGPRVEGETLEMRALPGNKHSLVDRSEEHTSELQSLRH